MTRTNFSKITKVFIYVSLAIILVYDVIAAVFGTGSTISNVTTAWAYKYPLIPVLYGVLGSHLFFPSNDIKTWRYIGITAMGLAYGLGGAALLAAYPGNGFIGFVWHPMAAFIVGAVLVVAWFPHVKK